MMVSVTISSGRVKPRIGVCHRLSFIDVILMNNFYNAFVFCSIDAFGYCMADLSVVGIGGVLIVLIQISLEQDHWPKLTQIV